MFALLQVLAGFLHIVLADAQFFRMEHFLIEQGVLCFLFADIVVEFIHVLRFFFFLFFGPRSGSRTFRNDNTPMVCLMTGQGGGQGVCRKGRGLHRAEAVSHAVRHERHESQVVPAEVVGELQTVFPGRLVVLVGFPGICIFAVVPEGASVLVEGLVEGHDEV